MGFPLCERESSPTSNNYFESIQNTFSPLSKSADEYFFSQLPSFPYVSVGRVQPAEQGPMGPMGPSLSPTIRPSDQPTGILPGETDLPGSKQQELQLETQPGRQARYRWCLLITAAGDPRRK